MHSSLLTPSACNSAPLSAHRYRHSSSVLGAWHLDMAFAEPLQEHPESVSSWTWPHILAAVTGDPGEATSRDNEDKKQEGEFQMRFNGKKITLIVD